MVDRIEIVVLLVVVVACGVAALAVRRRNSRIDAEVAEVLRHDLAALDAEDEPSTADRSAHPAAIITGGQR